MVAATMLPAPHIMAPGIMVDIMAADQDITDAAAEVIIMDAADTGGTKIEIF